MIYIPAGKALVAVENYGCKGCMFFCPDNGCTKYIDFPCEDEMREDGKNVMYQMLNWPENDQKPPKKLINGVPVEMIIHK